MIKIFVGNRETASLDDGDIFFIMLFLFMLIWTAITRPYYEELEKKKSIAAQTQQVEMKTEPISTPIKDTQPSVKNIDTEYWTGKLQSVPIQTLPKISKVSIVPIPREKTKIGKYMKSSKILGGTKLDEEDIDLLIEKYPWYASERDILLEIASSSSVDLLLMFAIGQLESCNGTKGRGSKINNIWGHMNGNKLKKYASKKDGLIAAHSLLEKYTGKGKVTIEAVAKKYNPGRAKYLKDLIWMMNHLGGYLNDHRSMNAAG